MKLVAAYLLLVALITGTVLAVADGGDESPPGGGRRVLGGGDVELASLSTFEDCGAVEDWFREVVPQVEELSSGFSADDAGGAAESAPAPAAAGATAGAGVQRDSAASGAEGDQAFSTTNLQERDVDEPDVVKTNGEIIVVATAGAVRIVDAAAGEELATVELGALGGGEELLLRGDRLLVVGQGFRPGPSTRPLPAEDRGVAVDRMPAGEEVTRLTAVDLADPSDPQVVGTADLDGGYVSARLVGDTARLVLRSYPTVAPTGRLEAATLLPAISVDGDAPEPLVACDDVRHPAEPSTFGTTSVVTLDVTGRLEPLDTDTVAADAATVYASTDRLYVATQRYGRTPATELHAFDIEDPERTTYVGSGLAEGTLLNQFSLSERHGVLRVATTLQRPTGETESALTTFGEDGDRLTELGRVTGLGPDEQIHAVRFIEDIAFVVTFRQTDPLYAVDVSDPAAPRLLGELKIPGFSAYLHPVGTDRLLGVGQDATDQGQRLGTQVSLFDVGDLAAPTRLDALSLRNASSPVEFDHKAFLWWPGTDVAVVPVERYDPDGRSAPDLHALVVGVEDDHLEERGTVTHAGQPGWVNAYPPSILRSLVVDDVLWTLSEAGLLGSDLGSLAEEHWVPFPVERFRRDVGIAVPAEG